MNVSSDKIFFIKHLILNVFLYVPIYILNHIDSGFEKSKLYFGWEEKIPLIDWMIIPYLLFFSLFLLPLFLLPRNEMKKISLSFALCTICAGIIFFLLPTEYGFMRSAQNGSFAAIYEGMFAIDPFVNPFPSLHVAYSFLYFLYCFRFLNSLKSKIFLMFSISIIMSSTIFTHQHHILDVLSGILLAYFIYLIVNERPFWNFGRY